MLLDKKAFLFKIINLAIILLAIIFLVILIQNDWDVGASVNASVEFFGKVIGMFS